jgi:hypothetical protein
MIGHVARELLPLLTQSGHNHAAICPLEQPLICCSETKETDQGQRKQNEFEWNPESEDRFGQFRLGQFLTDPASSSSL